MIDPFGLQRFVVAQERIYGNVLDELGAGAKSTHWMWFVFPQLRELGRSGIAKQYGISSLAEAVAYVEHPVLGERLLECTRLMLSVGGKSARQILGTPDDLKFRSCMTLFSAARADLPVWDAALTRYFGGLPDAATLALI